MYSVLYIQFNAVFLILGMRFVPPRDGGNAAVRLNIY